MIPKHPNLLGKHFHAHREESLPGFFLEWKQNWWVHGSGGRWSKNSVEPEEKLGAFVELRFGRIRSAQSH